jgi:hypothetical protein
VVAVFTKFDQFKLDIQMRLEDEDRDPTELRDEAEKRFRDDYFSKLIRSPPHIRLESEDFVIN